MNRALVTGASGFLGAALVEHLLAAGVVTAIVRRPDSNLWRLGGNVDRVHAVVGDLARPESYEAALGEFRPDTLFHLGWHGVGPWHRNDPVQVEVNLHATLGLLRLAAAAGCTAWIGAGSQAEYGPQNRRLDEEAPTRPTTLYGAAKLSACHLCGRVADLGGMRFAWLRVFSTFGPGDNPDWMLPTLIRRLLARERPALTAGEQRWDYLYGADAAEAFLRVGQTPTAAGVFNLGSGEARPLREIVERVRDRIDPGLPLGFGEVPYRADQVMWLEADIARLRHATGWRPRHSLDQGLDQTVAWHRAQIR